MKNKRFEEIKIKMVMKLRGLTREAAIRALQIDKSTHGSGRSKAIHLATRAEHPMTAKEFFEDFDDDDEIMPA